MAGEDVEGLLARLGASKPPLGRSAGSARSGPLQGPPHGPGGSDEQRRLRAFHRKLEELFPEPPEGWLERAKPPGSTPRTAGTLGPTKARM
jgi:hypothetical protein